MAESTAPSLGLLCLEPQRAVLEGLSYPAAAPLLRRAPEGEGQPVLVLPGFMASDLSTKVLRRYLKQQGFSPHPWLLGRNLGPQNGTEEGMYARVADLFSRYKQKVSVVGWSLGGVYAREAAKTAPEQVRQVISLGSPFADITQPSNATRMFDFISKRTNGPDRSARMKQIQLPPDVPSTAIYSKTDGIVHWSTCLEPETDHTENIEVKGSHCGLGVNPVVLYSVAERLSQPEGQWEHFRPSGWQKVLYTAG